MRFALAGTLATTLLVAAPAHAGTDEYENKKAAAYLKVGVQRQESGDCKGAVAAFKRGIDHRPLAELNLHMGQCLRTLGDGPGAVAAFRAYLKANPAAPDRAEIERIIADGGRGGTGSSNPAPAGKGSASTRKAEPAAPSTPADPDEESDPFSQPAARAPAVEKCPRGQRRTPATAGHCCWPEQVWAAGGKQGGQCFGTPVCPRNFKLVSQGNDKSCVFVDPTLPRKDGSCAAGRELTEDHCCWPDQEWLDDQCSGRPSCPRGMRRQGEDCLPDDGG